MDDETGETMVLGNEGDLPLPEIDRIVVQDMEERVVLRRGQRQLEDTADEERQDGTAAAPLGIEMGHRGKGHIVREVQRPKPLWIPVQGTRAEPPRRELLSVGVDPFDPP